MKTHENHAILTSAGHLLIYIAPGTLNSKQTYIRVVITKIYYVLFGSKIFSS